MGLIGFHLSMLVFGVSQNWIPTDLFTPVFALSRVAGYLAHWREQMADNKLFRPGQIFVGKRGATYTDIADR